MLKHKWLPKWLTRLKVSDHSRTRTSLSAIYNDHTVHFKKALTYTYRLPVALLIVSSFLNEKKERFGTAFHALRRVYADK